MPAEMERKLKAQAKKKGVKNPDAYIYGTMRKTGWEPSHQDAAKRRLQKRGDKSS